MSIVTFFAGLRPYLGLIVGVPLLLLGPGYLLERLLRPWTTPPPLLARLTVWIALSFALVPLCYLWATTLGVALTVTIVRILIVSLGIAVAWRLWRDLAQDNSARLRSAFQAHAGPVLLFVLIVGLTAWKRWQEISDLTFPPWVDGLHHTLITRVTHESGMAPYSLRPYLPIDRLTYHWGYHAVGGTLLHLTGLRLTTFVLWFGQLLAVLQVVTLAGCAAMLWRRSLAASGTAFVVGLVSIMPAYYLSWSRYTLLAGTMMLPAAMIAAWTLVQAPRWRGVLLLAVLLGGLNLVHFVVFCCALLWCGAAWLSNVASGRRTWRALVALALAGLSAFALTAPWMLTLLDRTVPGVISGSPMRVIGGSYNAVDQGLLWAANNRLLLAAACVAAYLTLQRRARVATAILLWCLLVAVCANPVWLGLPYLSFFTNRIVAILTFVPAGLLVGGGIASINGWVEQVLENARWRRQTRLDFPSQPLDRSTQGAGRGLLRIWRALWLLALMLLAIWSAEHLLPNDLVLNRSLIHAHSTDLQAIEWIGANLPPDARFAVNTEGWLPEVPRGSDGGWWILPLTGRQVSTPPVIFNYGEEEFVKRVNAVAGWLRDTTDTTPQTIAAFMRRERFGYAYATPEGRVLQIARLRESPLFEEVYLNGEVSIFRLLP